MNAIELALVKFRNARAIRQIDRKRSGIAPEVRPVSITPNQASLMYETPRVPARKDSVGANYVFMVKHADRVQTVHGVHGLYELKSAPFAVPLERVARASVSRKRYMLETPSASSLVPDFSGFDTLKPAPYRIVDGRKVWLP